MNKLIMVALQPGNCGKMDYLLVYILQLLGNKGHF